MANSAGTEGLVVAVTGGARGIGLAIATLLHKRGAKVAIGDIDDAEVRSVGHRLGLPLASPLDVTSDESFSTFLDAVEQALGPIDVLVNNAGIIAVGPAIDEPDAVTKRVLAVNAYGTMLGTKLAVTRMRPRGRGHVINIASAGAKMVVPGIATYCATKHAVLGFTDAVRLENRRSGVQFSVVMPSLTKTEMLDGIGHARGFKDLAPDDVAQAVLGLIKKPKPHAIVPKSFGTVALAARRFLPRPAYEFAERVLGAERVFQDDVVPERRVDYVKRAGTS